MQRRRDLICSSRALELQLTIGHLGTESWQGEQEGSAGKVTHLPGARHLVGLLGWPALFPGWLVQSRTGFLCPLGLLALQGCHHHALPAPPDKA